MPPGGACLYLFHTRRRPLPRRSSLEQIGSLGEEELSFGFVDWIPHPLTATRPISTEVVLFRVENALRPVSGWRQSAHPLASTARSSFTVRPSQELFYRYAQAQPPEA